MSELIDIRILASIRAPGHDRETGFWRRGRRSCGRVTAATLIISFDAMGLVVGRLDGPVSRGRTVVTSASIPDTINPLSHSQITDHRSHVGSRVCQTVIW